MPLESCTGGHGASKSSRDPKTWTIAHETVRNARNHEFSRCRWSLEPGVTGHRNPSGTQKPWTIAHENGKKCPKSRVFMIPVESCTGGHGASKSYRGPKNVDYSPRKRPEMPEITSFDDAARVVHCGHRASKSSRDPKIVDYNPRKWQEMLEITSFDDAARVVYRGHGASKSSRDPKT